mmetsp:Transcript_37851/g.27864  ORF Transcript_37851/g.27864 Transcript_37851/m.27864 type:complete len:199 (+) Transcript_37851:182-778(+)
MLFKQETPSALRWFAVALAFTFWIAGIIYKSIVPYNDEAILVYMSVNLVCLATAFMLNKQVVSRTKLNLVVVTFWAYTFGFLCTFIVMCIQADDGQLGDQLSKVFLQDMQVFGVIFFSCFNEVFNYILLLYLMRKGIVTKAAIFGSLSSLFVILYGLVNGYYIWQAIIQICAFFISYVTLFFERKRDKTRKLNKEKDK